MSSNKRAKEKLIERYGGIDFLDQLQVKIPESRTYKSKGQMKRMKQLTYHHITEKSRGRTSNSREWSFTYRRTSYLAT